MTKSKTVEIKKYGTYWDRNRQSGGYLLRHDMGEVFVRFVRFVLLFGMCFLILQPILNKISVSFMEQQDLYNPIVVSIPLHFTGENYKLAAEIMSYKEALKNSIIISLTIAIIQTAMCTIVGYGFSRFKFPLKNFWFGCVLALIIVPPQAFSSSLVLHFSNYDIFGIFKALKGGPINLRGSVVPYYLMSFTCMGLKNGLYIYLVRQFFRNIPVDLEEAAYIDGCGMFKTFTKIMVPQSKPIVTSCFLFSLVWQWTDGFYSKLFIGGKKLVSTSLASIADALGVYIARQSGAANAQVSVSTQYTNCILSTGTLLIVLPIVVVYLIAQKAFVESISSTGIKM
ncbi:MAG: carbohydrate ABC transporter permease [Lachnospiraceae bacterium]|nr:carbohydrate ABC transporter permease [Lachnospiraceae bacterium]